MEIKIRGASEHNLKNIDVDIYDGLTVVTGVSGSGKSSLIFDILYKEARRRFLEAFSVNKEEINIAPAKVRSITGIGPTIALGQNLLNRNPNSILASAMGLIPLLKLLYARYGKRRCHICGNNLYFMKEEQIISKIEGFARNSTLTISVLLVQNVKGSHMTLLESLIKEFGQNNIIVDGKEWDSNPLTWNKPHNIQITLNKINSNTPVNELYNILQTGAALGANSYLVKTENQEIIVARVPVCTNCGGWFGELEPTHFKRNCPYCKGKGCIECNNTGFHPLASNVTWSGLLFPKFLEMNVGELLELFSKDDLPASDRLIHEIKRRLAALDAVGLKYLTLDRISPTLSRGESQRVRLAITLLSELEDITHILDEPTIGQHPADVARLLPKLNKLAGPVIYIEHDRLATIMADQVIDIGPSAGNEGGEIIFTGTPAELWKADTSTGKFFSFEETIKLPQKKLAPQKFLSIKGANKHNLKNIDVKIALNRFNIITGISGSGKSTLIEEILYNSIKQKKPIGCDELIGPKLNPVLVDQSPIGKNPRSNPATYTKIAEIIRKLYEKNTRFKATYFSFNTSEGQCPTCNGMGALEIKMRYLPSNWITCADCGGQRFSEEVLLEKVNCGDRLLSIAELYDLPIHEVTKIFENENRLTAKDLMIIKKMLKAFNDIGLGYISLGQPSPTLSGGEAQRIKLSKYLGRNTLENQIFILDEPSTGLHPKDLAGLLTILKKLIESGATIVIIEHNIDMIRAADWIIDLGPGSGPKGGELVYQGTLEGLMKNNRSFTSKALKEDASIKPTSTLKKERKKKKSYIVIENAHVHNLKNISTKIPKGKLIVVTGVSGSGKSSLIIDTLEAEARRRYFETLSMYERQSTKERSEALVSNISGLGITALISSEKKRLGWFFNLRITIGRITDINLHLANLFSYIGDVLCPTCKQHMVRKEKWYCEKCNVFLPIAKPRHFISSNYSAACLKCNGIGSNQVPNPDKLIIHPEKPLCKGAMYSPGFFPKGYLCKPYNVGYYFIQALADRYGFNQFETPWNEMSEEAKKAFLFGAEKPLTCHIENKKGQRYTKDLIFKGFYEQWLRDWDTGGTFTDTMLCSECNGTGFRPQYLKFSFLGYNIHEIAETPLNELYKKFREQSTEQFQHDFIINSFKIIFNRLEFLVRIGLGYTHLNRVVETLSAGEAQRIRLAGLIGSNLSSLTILLDEPSRGLHPSELQSLLNILRELRDKGNTIIIIEHDLLFIESAEYIIDMGPEAGLNGGEIVAKGSIEEIKKTNTITAEWLNGKRKFNIPSKRRTQKKWLKIHGAYEHNLKGGIVKIPHGCIVGICGISGSGKSTLLIDTLGRALIPKNHTTSVSREPIKPGIYDKIEGTLPQTIIIDQTKKKIGSPLKFLGLEQNFVKIYAETEDCKFLNLSEKDLTKKCSICNGKGYTKIDMKFLPDIIEICDVCKGSGLQAKAHKIYYKDISYSELNNLSIKKVFDLFKDNVTIANKLKNAIKVGLGYLQLNQPARTLSGGEAQRLKIVKELGKKTKKNTLYILDEPTIGQHLEDVSKLIDVLHLLVENGHTVVIIEHHPYILAACDWLIEMGPGAGPEGGRVIAKGPPEHIAKGLTPTAKYIKEVLEVLL